MPRKRLPLIDLTPMKSQFIDLLRRIAMRGGQVAIHHEQVHIDPMKEDDDHPATKHMGPTVGVFDEIYIIKKYDGTKVHRLLTLDRHPYTGVPGEYPVAWCKQFGKGR